MRRYRFELSRLEMMGVVGAVGGGLFVVFLLGVYAGRGLVEPVAGGARVVRVPVESAGQAPAEEDLTFYETLGRPEAEAGKADAPTRAVDAGGPAVSADAATAPPAADVAIEETDLAAGTGRDAPVPAVAETPPAERARPAAAPADARPTRRPEAEQVAVALEPPRRARGEWTVQVAATRDPKTAETIMRRLRARGYDAFVVQARRQGTTFHRVRVGRYGSIDQANEAVARLRREPGVPEAFVASD